MTEIEDKLDYSKTPMASHSVLGVRKVSPLSIPQPLPITASGGDAFDFILSPGVIQPNKCKLTFKLNLTAGGAGNFNWLNTSSLPIFRQVTAQLENGFQLCDLQEADKQYELVWAAEMSQQELLSTQDFVVTGSYMDFLHQSNASTVYLPDNATAITAASAGGKAYIGHDFTNVVAAANTAGVVYVSVPFDKLFCNTVLAEKRLLYIPKNLIIRLTLNPLSKLGFTSTSASDPTAGLGALVAGAGTNIEEVIMNVAYEKSPEIISNMMGAVAAGALTFLTPYQRILYNGPLSGTSQGTALRINSAMGDLKLRRTYLALFNSTTSGATAYDHACISPYSGITFTDRVQAVTAETLDNSPMQDFNAQVTATKKDDWDLWGSQVLAGSAAAVDFASYRYRWMLPRLWDEERSINRDYTKSKGVPLLPNEVQYAYTLQTASATNNHFVVGVFERKLAISREGYAWVFS